MQSTKTRRLLMVALGVVALSVLSIFGFYKILAPSPNPVTPVVSRPQPPREAKKQPAPKPREQEAKSEGTQNALVHQVLNSASTVGDLARMRGRKHVLEQEVRIAELEQQLNGFKHGVPKKQEITLPDLTPPKGREMPVPVAMPVAAPPKRGPVVLSVQGTAGKVTATIRTSEGSTVTINNGGSFGGGILQVTRRGVSIRRGGKLTPVPFE